MSNATGQEKDTMTATDDGLQAASSTSGSPTTVKAADQVDLGSFSAKPTTTTEGQRERAGTVWRDGDHETGIWEATVGSFTAVREGYTEICYIISGRVTVRGDGEDAKEIAAGDILVMPSGWRGSWDVHEPVVKHYTIISD